MVHLKFKAPCDINLKDNIVEIDDDMLDKVNQLNCYEFTYKGKKEKHIGIMAQELEAVLPDAVFQNANGIKLIKVPAVLGMLVKAVQELSAKIGDK